MIKTKKDINLDISVFFSGRFVYLTTSNFALERETEGEGRRIYGKSVWVSQPQFSELTMRKVGVLLTLV